MTTKPQRDPLIGLVLIVLASLWLRTCASKEGTWAVIDFGIYIALASVGATRVFRSNA